MLRKFDLSRFLITISNADLRFVVIVPEILAGELAQPLREETQDPIQRGSG